MALIIIVYTYQWFLNFSESRRPFSIKIFFRGVIYAVVSKSTYLPYIKTTSVFGLSKYSCIRKIFSKLTIYFSMKIENSDHRGGGFIHISDFFEGVKVKFFRLISKPITYLVSLVLESTKYL